MRDRIIEIADKLRDNEINENEAKSLFFELFHVSDGFVSVSEETPPSGVEVLAKSPSGIVHIANWREAYNIFTCQCKGESSYDWEWKHINNDVSSWNDFNDKLPTTKPGEQIDILFFKKGWATYMRGMYTHFPDIPLNDRISEYIPDRDKFRIWSFESPTHYFILPQTPN